MRKGEKKAQKRNEEARRERQKQKAHKNRED